MCRSSRIIVFLSLAAIITAVAPVEVQARSFGFAGARFGLGGARVAFGTTPRFGVRPGIRPNIRPGVLPGVQPGVAPGIRGRLGRFGRGYGEIGGFGGYGAGTYDFGFGGADLPLGGLLPPPEGVGAAEYGVPSGVSIERPKPVCPLIIQVGAGLRHAARTKIVYGHQPACR